MRVGEGGRWESGEGVWRPGSVQCHRRAHLGHPGPLDCACVRVCVCVCRGGYFKLSNVES